MGILCQVTVVWIKQCLYDDLRYVLLVDDLVVCFSDRRLGMMVFVEHITYVSEI